MKNWATLFLEDFHADDGVARTRVAILIFLSIRPTGDIVKWIDSLAPLLWQWTTSFSSYLWSIAISVIS